MHELKMSPPWRPASLFRLRFLLLFVSFTLISRMGRAQSAICTPISVDEAIAKIHSNLGQAEYQNLEELGHVLLREKRVGMSEVQPVELQVDVDQQGKTTAVKPVSGMHELATIYVDRFSHDSWTPFKHDGQPVCAQFMVRVIPRLEPQTGPEFKGKDRFHSALQKCMDASRSGENAAGLIAICQQAADTGDVLPTPYFGKDKRLAYVTIATAMMRANRAKDALGYAEEAVQTVEAGWDDVTGKASAYGVRGQARALTGDVKGAIEDLTKAETLERATFEVPRKPEQKALDKHALKSMLGFHAAVLTALNQKAEAEKLQDEAQKL